MGVRQQHEGDVARREGETAVERARLAPALAHAALDQELHFSRVDQVAGAGDLAGGAKKAELHAAQLTAPAGAARQLR